MTNPYPLISEAHEPISVPTTRFSTSKTMLYSLIYGRLWAYHIRNTDHDDFLEMVKSLARILVAQGYSLESLKPVFQRATARILQSDPRIVRPQQPVPDQTEEGAPASPTPIIFHLKYHPRGLTRQQV
jgi:hypothetical protein